MTESFGDILHVVERCRGGVATYVQQMMEWQRGRAGYGRILLAADPRLLDPALAEVADGVKLYKSGRSFLGATRAAKQVRRIIRDERPGVVHLHSSFPGLYGRMGANLSPGGPAIVYCPHGWSFEMESPQAKRALYIKLENWLATRADLIVSISEHERLAALAEGLPDAGHIAIPHGAPPPKPGSRPSPMEIEGLQLLFVGRFDRQKGLELLLGALPFVQRQDFTLHLIGAPELSDKPSVDLSDPRIHAHGWVDHCELDRWYAAADAVIIPSRWEGFGLVAIEAMRNGVAVLGSDRGALPEVLDMGRAGAVFDPENPQALAKLLDELTTEQLKALGAAGKARYESVYTFERAASALERGYSLALARRSVRS